MKIRWEEGAAADLDGIFHYVAGDNAAAAERQVERVITAVGNLSVHPAAGRPGRVSGTRELVIPPYLVAYRVKAGAVQVLRVLHAARRWPEDL